MGNAEYMGSHYSIFSLIFCFAMIWWSGHLLLPFVTGSEYAHHPPRNLKIPAPLGEGTGNEDQSKPVDPSYATPDKVYKAGDKVDCTTPWRRLSTRTSAWRRPASPRSSARTCTS